MKNVLFCYFPVPYIPNTNSQNAKFNATKRQPIFSEQPSSIGHHKFLYYITLRKYVCLFLFFLSLIPNISQFPYNRTSASFKFSHLLSLLVHKIPHALTWDNHLRHLKQKQCKHSRICQDILIVL